MKWQPYIPHNPTICIVGDVPIAEDEKLGIPFSGSAGRELNAQLTEAGINPMKVMKTLVFSTRPFAGKIESFCASKKEVGGKEYPFPKLSNGNYIKPEHFHDLTRLKEEIESVPSINLVIAAGNAALWALCQSTGITRRRGYLHRSTLVKHKILPILHPSAILRQFQHRSKSIVDFTKAINEAKSPEINLPTRSILINPTIEEVEAYCGELMVIPKVSTDIETIPSKRLITMVGFAKSPTDSIVIPFCDKNCVSYWKLSSHETRAHQAIARVLLKHPYLIAQNAAYELQWFWAILGIPPRVLEDTMLIHHALQPEMQKSLEFLASIYCNLPYWKDWSRGNKNKRDE